MSEQLSDIPAPTGQSRFNVPAGEGFVRWLDRIRQGAMVRDVEVLGAAKKKAEEEAAASRTYADTAASAALKAFVGSGASFTVVQGGPVPSALSLLRGAPQYIAGKFAEAVTNAVLQVPAIPDSSKFYTYEFWIKTSGVASSKVLLSMPGRYLGITGAGLLFFDAPANAIAGTAINDNQWHHIAVVLRRAVGTSNTYQGLWRDGVQVATATPTTSYTAWPAAVLGGFAASGSDVLVASFDSLRVSAGAAARYSGGSFTPPVTAPVFDSDTQFLAPCDSLAATGRGTGYSPRPAGAPNGSVTYKGSAEPTDAMNLDDWIKV